ncbi:hypothetical protein CEXT_334531 [Caerostris extrusa]|uniref:Uncharacterized protein n=1 Tax=Caerostris extrusa TaxID=172846 RepID=A0AAV4T5S7_CAEEX|nr:hypothetical protein CEXT_334531 [Caerostris extrusa]
MISDWKAGLVVKRNTPTTAVDDHDKTRTLLPAADDHVFASHVGNVEECGHALQAHLASLEMPWLDRESQAKDSRLLTIRIAYGEVVP